MLLHQLHISFVYLVYSYRVQLEAINCAGTHAMAPWPGTFGTPPWRRLHDLVLKFINAVGGTFLGNYLGNKSLQALPRQHVEKGLSKLGMREWRSGPVGR